jgi:hypothetical protein
LFFLDASDEKIRYYYLLEKKYGSNKDEQRILERITYQMDVKKFDGEDDEMVGKNN